MDDRTPQASGWSFPEQPEPHRPFPTGKAELVFCAVCLLLALGLGNSILCGGFNLGFALFAGAGLLGSVVYLLLKGHRLTLYSGVLLGLSLVLIAGFARSSDGFVKFVCFFFLLVSANLGLCLLAGQNRWAPAGVRSLLDAPRTLFFLGIGKLSDSTHGVVQALRSSGTAAKKSGAGVLWADVDTAVAHYNVRAYQSGQLQSIDIRHLNTLGDGAVPYLMELTQDPDPDIAAYATRCLQARKESAPADFRSWNYAKGATVSALEGFFG